MKKISALSFLVLLAFVAAPSAQAEPVTFNFSGVITSVEDTTTNQVLGGTGIEAGTSTFTASLTYDPLALPNWTSPPNRASYPAGEYTITIDGNYNFVLNESNIGINNDDGAPLNDSLGFSIGGSNNVFGPPITTEQLGLALRDYSAQAFSDTSLPAIIDLSKFDEGLIYITGWEDTWEKQFQIIGEINGVRGMPNIDVTWPNGGEVLHTCQDYTITWNSNNISGNIVEISLIKGDFPDLLSLAANVPNTGSYPFNLPNSLEDGSDYFIAIVAETLAWPELEFTTFRSDDFFTIQTAVISQLTVTYPGGGEFGEVLTKGQDYTITWDSDSTNGSGNIQIDLYKGGDDPNDPDNPPNFVAPIAADVPDTGNYPFNPPDYLENGSDYFIRISAECGVSDFSDESFTIQSACDLSPSDLPPSDHIYDDFSGTNIDESKWQIRDENDAMMQYDGILHIDAPPYGAWASVSYPTSFSGDFDIVLYWRYCYQGSIIWINNVPQVFLQVGSENGGFFIARADFRSGGAYFSEGASNGNFMGHYGASTFDTSGRFRITRTGSEVTTYYWDNGWQQLLNYQNFVLDDVSFNLTAFTGDNQEAVFHAGFDRVDIIGTPATSNQPPTVPVLFSPANNESNVNPNNVILSWNPSTDPDNDEVEYCITVNEDAEPDDIPIFTGCDNDIFTSNTSFTLLDPLEPGKTYYWAVWAKDDQGNWSPASAWWSFITTNMIYGLFVGQDSIVNNLRADLTAKEISENFRNLNNVRYNKVITDDWLPITPWEISWHINKIKETIRPGDIFIMYIAGHGDASTQNEDKDETTLTEGDEYIWIGDFPADPFMFKDDELVTLLTGMDNIEKWILVDSCKSGGFWGNHNPNDSGDLEKLNFISMFAASAEDGYMHYDRYDNYGEDGRPFFGVATREALSLGTDGYVQADLNQNGILTFDELVLWVQDYPRTAQWLEGSLVAEGDFGDPIAFSLDLWSQVSEKSDDFIGALSTDSPGTLAAKANGPYSGSVGSPITLDAAGSYSPNGDIVLYEWDCDNDGVFDYSSIQPTITHTYSLVYNGTVTLRVTDNEGLTDIDSASVDVSGASICSNLGNNPHKFFSDWDKFTLSGQEGEDIFIRLEPDPSGFYEDEYVTLILKDRIRRFWWVQVYRDALFEDITVNLPRTGEYSISVVEQRRNKNGFNGDYCLTLKSSQDAWQTLEATRWVE